MAFYIDTRIQRSAVSRARRKYPACTMWLIGRPRVGAPMTLVSQRGHSMVTSTIVRILDEASHDDDRLFVETNNSVYCLRRGSFSEVPDRAEFRDTSNG